MIELHWVFIAAYLLVDYGFWLWRGHLHRREKRLLKEEVAGLERMATMGKLHMVGTWNMIFMLRDYAAEGHRIGAKSLVKLLDETINLYWKDPKAARDLISRTTAELAGEDDAETNPR